MPLPLPQGFSLAEDSSYAGGTKTFRVRANYAGDFTEALSSLQLGLASLPKGYEYGGETPSIDVVLESGLANNPISLTQDNILAFNSYANTPQGRSMHYRLVADIVLEAPVSGASNWTAIGTNALNQAFTGSLDGNDHTLSGLVIDNPGSAYQGLFGCIVAPAEIKNLGLIGLRVSASGYNSVGGLVGYSNGGIVENSYVTGNVAGSTNVGGLVGANEGGTVENSYVMGGVSGSSNVGGLVGYNSGTVQHSYATSSVVGSNNYVGGLVGTNGGTVLNPSTVRNSYATGSVTGSYYVGGLVGQNYATSTVENSYATGSVSGSNEVGGLVGNNHSSTVRNSYATGSVEGNNVVGGLVGYNYGTVENSYATGRVEGSYNVGGVVGDNIIMAVQNCVALNPSVSASSASVGRVVGSRDSTMINNHARSDMELNFQPTPGPYSKDGADAFDYGTRRFWEEEPLSWNFSTIWEWGPNDLPILQNVGGEQNHTVP
jgi:hypothetical protein